MNQCFHSIRIPPYSHDTDTGQPGERFFPASQNSHILQKLIFLLREQDASIVDHRNIIRNLVEVTRYVGGNQHGMLSILNKLKEEIENLIPRHRV